MSIYNKVWNLQDLKLDAVYKKIINEMNHVENIKAALEQL